LSSSKNLVNFVKINIFITTASFCHFVSFLSKTKSFGAHVIDQVTKLTN